MLRKGKQPNAKKSVAVAVMRNTQGTAADKLGIQRSAVSEGA